DIVGGLGDGLVACRERCIRSPSEELLSRSTRAISDANRTRKLDEIPSSHQVTLEEGLQTVNGVVDSVVSVKVGLDVSEDDH
ncbi:hypothetical protein, partial [Klebsiella pneumoniae]|uniref:hypothetical protein n=1 Tax=Klebsiella pneumoniae TaxID=573 RepID=UPI003013EAC2